MSDKEPELPGFFIFGLLLSDAVCHLEVGTFLEHLFFDRWVLFLFSCGLRKIVMDVMPDPVVLGL